MIKPAKLYLIRHAPVKLVKGFIPEHNPDAVITKNQLKKLADLIPSNCSWYVSPLRRAVQTAEALSEFVSYSEMILEEKLNLIICSRHLLELIGLIKILDMVM